MKKNNRTANTGDAFIQACQKMHNVANICQNWLLLVSPQPLQLIPSVGGCRRSMRLARLAPVTHELTANSALLLAVVPAEFDSLRFHGYERPKWRIMVYSWLGREQTLSLISHLHTKLDCRDMAFLLNATHACELLTTY